jgi:mono/diheme cytochrome c family protein
MIKKILLALVALIVVAALGLGGFVFMQVSAYDESMAKVYDVPLIEFEAPDLSEVAGEGGKILSAASEAEPTEEEAAAKAKAEEEVELSDEEKAIIAEATSMAAEAEKLRKVYDRGEHLAKSIGSCFGCHGEDLATPEVIEMGPVGTVSSPNISMGGVLKDYSDAELHRLLTHGIKKDGTSLVFMPAQDFAWWPDADIGALIGFLRTRPAVERTSKGPEIGPMGKVLDRMDNLPIDIARRIDHKAERKVAETPEATAAYGAFIGKLCMGCHGPTLSGGPIPGAPPSMPIPLNITTHDSGIAHYDYAKFETLMRTGKKPDGSDLDPFMPIKDMKHMDDTEMKALWLYLESVPKKEFGGR